LNSNDLLSLDGGRTGSQLILFEAEISSDLNAFVNQSIEIAHSHPHLIDEIDGDLDLHGLKKKAEREADRRFFEEQNPCFDVLEDSLPPLTCSLELEGGRPRMPAIVVFVLLLLRGWIGGPKSSQFQLILSESITLHSFFEEHGCKVPGASTVSENINAVRNRTLDRILSAQLAHVYSEDLDSFEDVLIDSTSVDASSKYPTDSGLMASLAMRMTGVFERLKKLKLGLPNWLRRKAVTQASKIAEEIELNAKRIGMLSGKRNVKTQRKALYAKIYTRTARLARVFTPLLSMLQEAIGEISLPPSKAKVVQGLLAQCQQDLESIGKISDYSRQRVFRDKQAPAEEKIYSISDEDAAIIKKGGWDDTLGYRPQLAFSGNGLLIAHCLPVGNAADSGQLREVLEASERNTGVVPKRVTLDDGYSNGKVRNEFLAKYEGKIEVFSFAGAKGRQIIDKELYESEDYRKARSDRSAAESRVFTLKFNHGYQEVMRRGQEHVEHEQLTKGLAYNIRRIIWLKELKAREDRNPGAEKAA
jgi:hypothetical protein